MLSSDNAITSLSVSCDEQDFLLHPVEGFGFGSCRGWFASVMDLWGVALENCVYLWKCSTMGHRNMKKTQPVALGISFPS